MLGADFGGKNRTREVDGMLEISLNIEDDFPFEVDEVLVYYDQSENAVSIRSSRIPENIKKNMLRFFGGRIEEYIEFLDKNLECFFRGGVPESRAAGGIEDTCTQVRDQSYKKNQLKKIEIDLSPAIAYKGPLNIEIRAYKSNVSFLVCKKLNMQIECVKCKKNVRVEESQNCTNCSGLIGVRYSFVVNNNFLGNLALVGARFICFNDMDYQFSCLECGNVYESQIKRNKDARFKCSGCNKDILIKIQDINFKIKEHVKVVKGGELPNKGACVHYKKSLRWFKFPCCNNSFPCDICHDSESGHKAVLANKMICGMCGKEQSVKSDCSCGMNMNRMSAFWEGGKGTRNKSTMSKKDKKKYRK